jgi:hypothetical protein
VVDGVEAQQEQLLPEHRRDEHGHHNPELASCRLSGEEVGGERDGHIDGEVEVHGGVLEAVGLEGEHEDGEIDELGGARGVRRRSETPGEGSGDAWAICG